jgi:hypothetical protein
MAVSLHSQRVLSSPIPVWWAGFETTTTRLQQAGWSLSAEQDFPRYRVRLAMRHDGARLYAVSRWVDADFQSYHTDPGYRREFPGFQIAFMAPEIEVLRMVDDLSAFDPIDAYPQIATTDIKRIEDFGIFATPLARTEEIIVEPKDVMQLLDEIKRLQAPGQADIRRRERSRGEVSQRQQFHAQILSFAKEAA